MAHITHLLGSLLVMLWFAITFMGESIHKLIPAPYSDDLIRYRWLILGLGIFLTITGFVNRIKQKRGLRRNDSRWQKHSSQKHDSLNKNSNVVRKDFELEQRKQQFTSSINKNLGSQSAELKELAQKVEWSPFAGGGASFKTSFLYQTDQTRIEVLKSNGAKLFSGVFIALGGIVPAIITYSLIIEEGFGWEVIGIMAFGSIFVLAGVAMLYFPKPRVFDKQLGWFWAGSKKLSGEQELSLLKKSARLNEIAAIQIISERLSGKNSSYTSWEINLVSHDAQRLNVMDHGNKRSIQEDAQKLGEFLGVPVWENT